MQSLASPKGKHTSAEGNALGHIHTNNLIIPERDSYGSQERQTIVTTSSTVQPNSKYTRNISNGTTSFTVLQRNENVPFIIVRYQRPRNHFP